MTVNAPETVTANFAPVTIAVPNVIGLTRAAASAAITGAGLVVGNVSRPPTARFLLAASSANRL